MYKIKKKKLIYFFTFIFLTLLFLQLPFNSNLKLYYLFLPVLILISYKWEWVKRLFLTFTIYFFLIILITDITMFNIYGYRIDNIRILILILSFMAGFFISNYISIKDINKMASKIFYIILTFIFIRIFMLPTDFINLLLRGRHYISDNYFYFTNGGHNIEVTFFAFLTMLLKKKLQIILMLIITFFFSILYESRIGVILCLFIILFKFYDLYGFKKSFIFFLGSILILISFIYIYKDKPNSVFYRFIDYKKELEYGEEGIGRVGFYIGSYYLLSNNIYTLLGVGSGNAVYKMSEVTGIIYKENNVHNIYLQILLDGGVQSFFVFFLLTLLLIYRTFRDRFISPYSKIVFSYLLIGLIQFTGYDTVGWFFIGMFYHYFYHRNAKINLKEK